MKKLYRPFDEILIKENNQICKATIIKISDVCVIIRLLDKTLRTLTISEFETILFERD